MASRKKMKSALESMMFVWGEPLSIRDAAEVLEEDKKVVRELFEELQAEYESEGRGIRLREIDGAFQFVTLADNEFYISRLCTPVKIKRLSQAALEVLAIIAYKQPVTRAEFDSIRGIKSERVIENLMAKELVCVKGRSEGIGRPLLYGTTKEFLLKFGFASLRDLPEIEGFENMNAQEDREVGLHEQLLIDWDEAKDEDQ